MWRNREGKLRGRKQRDGFDDGLLIVLPALFVKSDERRCLFCHECLLLASDDVLPMRRSVSIIARTREQNFFDLALCRKQLTSAFVLLYHCSAIFPCKHLAILTALLRRLGTLWA